MQYVYVPIDLTNENMFTYFIDNQPTADYQSILYGLRELNSTEIFHSCSNIPIINIPIINERYNFTSNYQLRIHTRSCYYLDKNNNRQSNVII